MLQASSLANTTALANQQAIADELTAANSEVRLRSS